MERDLQRMTDKTHEPTEEEIIGYIGERAEAAWREMRQFLESNYDMQPETIFYGAKYGWTIRYRKSGKTLCSLFPEKGGFTVLIVLGKKESDEFLSMRNEISSKVQELFKNTKPFHDGRWLWIRLLTKSDTDDVKKLLKMKRRPRKN